MKKLIFMLFMIFCVMSFSAIDKGVAVVRNDDYSATYLITSVSRGKLADKLFGWKKGGDLSQKIYSNLRDASKIEFIIEKKQLWDIVSIKFRWKSCYSTYTVVGVGLY